MTRRAQAYIGTSGWTYKTWRARFYEGIPQKRWLAHAAARFTGLEVNGSFYGQIAPTTFRRWREETPEDFRFTVKGHRFVTHYKRLRDARDSIERLLAPARELGDKLAAVVWQLPATFACDLARLDDFLGALRESGDDVRHALELRHRSWFTDEVAARLARARVASCVSDAPDFPMWCVATTDLAYVRLHGHTRKYASSYSRASLRTWAARVQHWLDEGRDVHVYFDNDAEGAAPRNALELLTLVNSAGGPARSHVQARRVHGTSACIP
jgi:uncharacterized protein YecE (DUF72 family)